MFVLLLYTKLKGFRVACSLFLIFGRVELVFGILPEMKFGMVYLVWIRFKVILGPYPKKAENRTCVFKPKAIILQM